MKSALASAICIVALIGTSTNSFAAQTASSTSSAVASTSTSGTDANTSSASSAVSDCVKKLPDGGKGLPTGVSANLACSTLLDTLQVISSVPVGKGSPTRLYDYSKENPNFYKSLQAGFAQRGGSKKIKIVIKTPVTFGTLRAAAESNDYKEIGLGVWLDRIDDTGGAICTKSTKEALGLGPALQIFDFLLHDALPWAEEKYNAAVALGKAKKMDALLILDDPTKGDDAKVMEIDFVKRGTAGCSAIKDQ